MPFPASPLGDDALLRAPGVRPAFLAACVARLGYGMVPLSLLLAVGQSTGSTAFAGATLSVYGLPTLLSPLKARAIDRYGRARVMLPLAAVFVLAFVALAAVAMVRPHWRPVMPVLALVAGVAVAPVGPVMRAMWAASTAPRLRRRAYSLDAVVEEVLFATGPVLAGASAAALNARAPLLVCSAFVCVGASALALTSSPVGPTSAADRASAAHPANRGLVAVLLLVAALGATLACLEVAVATRASGDHGTIAAGALLAVLSVGSAAGGLLWGRRQAAERRDELPLLLLALAVATALVAATGGLLEVLTLALCGATLAPSLVVGYEHAARSLDSRRAVEATTWVTTTHNLGLSAGALAAGVLVAQLGAAGALLVAAAALGAVSVTALAV